MFYIVILINMTLTKCIGSTSEEVRMAAFKQLLRLSKARVVARALNLDETSTKAPPPTPKQFLTRIVLKTPVPLW